MRKRHNYSSSTPSDITCFRSTLSKRDIEVLRREIGWVRIVVYVCARVGLGECVYIHTSTRINYLSTSYQKKPSINIFGDEALQGRHGCIDTHDIDSKDSFSFPQLVSLFRLLLHSRVFVMERIYLYFVATQMGAVSTRGEWYIDTTFFLPPPPVLVPICSAPQMILFKSFHVLFRFHCFPFCVCGGIIDTTFLYPCYAATQLHSYKTGGKYNTRGN